MTEKKPWDKPEPITVMPNGSILEIYACVGAALSRWALVEGMLLEIFCHLLYAKDQDSWYTASKIFGHLTSTSTRLEQMRVAGDAHFIKKPAHKDFLKANLNLVSNFLPRRNDIAHGVAVDYSTQDGVARQNGAALQTPHFNSKDFDPAVNKPGYKYNIDLLRDYEQSFLLLGLELMSTVKILFWDDQHALSAIANWTPLSQHLLPAKDNLKSLLSSPSNLTFPGKSPA
ncbi:MAG: hypothetical protein JWR07_5717 [Nevskia sp.]|nr:hypothetical protein [Nevskia sp.]